MISTEVIWSPGDASSVFSDGVWKLLRAVDDEFVPRLSSRTDTVATGSGVGGAIAVYMDAVRSESWVVATESSVVVGVASFLAGYRQPPLEQWAPSAYVTTIAVVKERRRQGIATAMYAELARAAERAGLSWVTTRTWSTNASHLGVLRRLEFEEVVSISAQRGPGVDTVYLARLVRASTGARP